MGFQQLTFVILSFAVVVDQSAAALPSFKWDSAFHQSHGGSEERLIIKFHDGGPDDAALLVVNNPLAGLLPVDNAADDDNCIYQGLLEHDANVSVALNGCPMNDTFEIVFDSSRLQDDMFSVVNGNVSVLEIPEDGVALDVNVGQRSLEARRSNIKTSFIDLPQKMTLNVTVYYDREWYNAFKSTYSKRMNSVLNLVQSIFMWSSLQTKISLKVVAWSSFTSYSLNAETDLGIVQKAARNSRYYSHAHMYLSYYQDSSKYSSAFGAASSIGGVCAKDSGDKAAIVEYVKNDIYTAWVFARQLGYLLGMLPDYQVKDGQRVVKPPRYDDMAGSCTNIGGIMDLASSKNKWSTCSNKDFKLYYNHVVSTAGKFCAPDCTHDIGVGCEFWETVGVCSYSQFSRLCSKTCIKC